MKLLGIFMMKYHGTCLWLADSTFVDETKKGANPKVQKCGAMLWDLKGLDLSGKICSLEFKFS